MSAADLCTSPECYRGPRHQRLAWSSWVSPTSQTQRTGIEGTCCLSSAPPLGRLCLLTPACPPFSGYAICPPQCWVQWGGADHQWQAARWLAGAHREPGGQGTHKGSKLTESGCAWESSPAAPPHVKATVALCLWKIWSWKFSLETAEMSCLVLQTQCSQRPLNESCTSELSRECHGKVAKVSEETAASSWKLSGAGSCSEPTLSWEACCSECWPRAMSSRRCRNWGKCGPLQLCSSSQRWWDRLRPGCCRSHTEGSRFSSMDRWSHRLSRLCWCVVRRLQLAWGQPRFTLTMTAALLQKGPAVSSEWSGDCGRVGWWRLSALSCSQQEALSQDSCSHGPLW